MDFYYHLRHSVKVWAMLIFLQLLENRKYKDYVYRKMLVQEYLEK